MAARAGAVKESAQPGSILLAVHDFVARSADELSLAKGDRIELIERDDEFGDGWFLGRHMNNGKTGLFPQVYTTPAPKGTFTATQRRRSDGPPKTPQESSGIDPAVSAANVAAQTGFAVQQPTALSQRPSSAQTTQGSYTTPMALRTSLPSSPPTARTGSMVNVDSPVMNETLSVIDEHMNNMSSPTNRFMNGSNGGNLSSTTLSSAQPLSRYSYIAGHETDEEEGEAHTEEEVMGWSPQQVAEYLEDHGVEKAHCECFKEQEISGEVLLAMEQSSIFLKEFDLGSVGRRLKTWHKVRALQDECRTSGAAKVARSNSEYSNVGDTATGDATRNRASTMGSILPRALDTNRQSITGPPQRSSTLQALSSQTAATPSTISPLQNTTSVSRPENTYRPSAQIIREMQHSRRHSSIDSTNTEGASRHRKQPSLDQKWQLGQPQTNGSNHSHTLSADTAAARRLSGYIPTTNSPEDLDRGYFSSNELDTRTTKKNVLTKRTSSSAAATPAHSRQSSHTRLVRHSTQGSRHLSSDVVDAAAGGYSASQSIFGTMAGGSTRSVTAPLSKPMNTTQETTTPVVTKLDSPTLGDRPPTQAAPNSPNASVNKFPFFSSKPKITGLRTISDAITRNEKLTASPTKDGVPFSSRTGSTTPSTESQSLDIQKSEVQSRTSNGSVTNLVPPAPRQSRMKTKSKKSTSAYTRGLEQKTPAETMANCDYSGWMKKKSGSLMTTWKPRLFVLRGRRLSYYYSDTDTEEKGLIDISFHRVLPAHNETLTGLHATMTGVVATPTSPKDSTTPTSAQEDLKANPPPAGDDSVFIFKLVPPKTGLSKGVNFTKPTVHYFAVNSRQEGRLWMAALMKATIDRDEDSRVTTTYNQKTISLARARARRERPPALREDDGVEGDGEDEGMGLGITEGEKEVVGGAEREGSSLMGTTLGGSSEMVNEKGAG